MAQNMQIDNEDGLFFSVYIGVLIADKEFNSDTVKVAAPSITPFMTSDTQEGLSGAHLSTEIRVNNLNNDTKFEDEITTKNYIEAVYFNLNTNRELPPDVRKGEQVILFRIQNTDTYYWLPLGRDDNLRRCERLKLRVSDDANFNKELTDDNTYYIDLDTLQNKHIWIKTSKSNGEKYSYQIKIDSVQNCIYISDDIQNEIRIESDNNRVYLSNTNGSFIDILGPNITINAPNSVTITSSTITLNASGQANISGGSVNINSAGTMSVRASGYNTNFKCTEHGGTNAPTDTSSGYGGVSGDY